jgi:hypothetical protein
LRRLRGLFTAILRQRLLADSFQYASSALPCLAIKILAKSITNISAREYNDNANVITNVVVATQSAVVIY